MTPTPNGAVIKPAAPPDRAPAPRPHVRTLPNPPANAVDPAIPESPRIAGSQLRRRRSTAIRDGVVLLRRRKSHSVPDSHKNEQSRAHVQQLSSLHHSPSPAPMSQSLLHIGRAHVYTPVTNAHLV